MADVAVEIASVPLLFRRTGRMGPVWTDIDTGYIFFIDSGFNIQYRKTSDGGATWGSRVAVTSGSQVPVYMDVWYDRWTPGDNGNMVHIWWIDEGTNHNINYRSLDISTDTLGTLRLVFDGASFRPDGRPGELLSGIKAVGGNLYVQFWGDINGERGFYRSEDGGATWFGRTDGADGDEVDEVVCLPDGDSVDNQDIVMIYWDRSTNEISIKKYDDSLNSWSETLISSSIVGNIDILQINAMVLHSDNHIIVVVWSETDVVTADLKVFDITVTTGIPTITTKTNVITDADDVVCVGLLINHNNNDLYVVFLGNEDSSEVYQVTLTAFYKKSTDGGDTWGSQTVYQQGAADDMRAIDAGCSTPGIAEGRFEPVFFNNNLDDLIVNKVNSVELLAVPGSGGGSHQSSGRGIHRGVLRGVA